MKQIYKKVLLLFLVFGVISISYAQKMSISGTVSDDSGVLLGVSVLIKGTSIGTDTDFDGKYKISASTGDVLVFRSLGYKTVEKTVGTSNVINVTMIEDSNTLEEVVIVAFGTTTKEAVELLNTKN